MANHNTVIPDEESSYFDGGYLAYFGCCFLLGFVSLITLGIAFPWMLCWFQRWKAKHTVICGKRMYFDGTGLQLIGKFLLWSLLSFITLGIYGLWMSIAIKKWIAKHMHYVGEGDNNSYFDGGVLGLLGTNILSVIVMFVPVVGFAWSKIIKIKWLTRHTVVDSRRHIFEGTVGSLFLKYLLWGLLTVITFGIFGLFVPVKALRWETENKIDNEHTTQEMIARGEYRANIHTDAASFKTFKVEDDMECIKAGITENISQEELLAMAENGVRAAQYTYTVRYGQGQYSKEPFAGFLRAAALAEYAPAISLYLQTNTVDEPERLTMLQKAADKGQIWALKACMLQNATEGLAMKEDKNALPLLKSAVRYADLLKENREAMTQEEEALVMRCVFAVRRIQSAKLPSGSGKIVGIVLAVLIGIPVIIALVVAALRLFTFNADKTPAVDSYYEEFEHSNVDAPDTDLPVSENKSNGIFDAIGSLFGGKNKTQDGAVMQGGEIEMQTVPSIPDDNITEEFVSGESDFWKRFTVRMDEEYCVLNKVDEASNGTVKYEITCNQYFWSSLHTLEILQDADGVHKMKLSGVRIYEPDSPDPTLNEAQWIYLVREIFKQLDLGTYEDITPYTAEGLHTELYDGWIFSYENTESFVSVTITKS